MTIESWQLWALLSAVFAVLTALFGGCAGAGCECKESDKHDAQFVDRRDHRGGACPARERSDRGYWTKGTAIKQYRR